MARVCELSGKKVMTGNNVSHANNRTKRRFLPNLQMVSLYSEVLGRSMRFKVCPNALRTVEKKGGIDKELYKSIAQSAIEGHLPHPKLIQNMDTEPREAVLSLMGKEFGSKFVEKEYKIKFNNVLKISIM